MCVYICMYICLYLWYTYSYQPIGGLSISIVNHKPILKIQDKIKDFKVLRRKNQFNYLKVGYNELIYSVNSKSFNILVSECRKLLYLLQIMFQRTSQYGFVANGFHGQIGITASAVPCCCRKLILSS